MSSPEETRNEETSEVEENEEHSSIQWIPLTSALLLALAFLIQMQLGVPALFLFLAALALSGVILLMWRSLHELNSESSMDFEEALSLAAPSATEEQKRATLRTLKDLEYELYVGKISREDYDQVSTEIRQKAKELIAMQDKAMSELMEKANKRLKEYELLQESKVSKNQNSSTKEADNDEVSS